MIFGLSQLVFGLLKLFASLIHQVLVSDLSPFFCHFLYPVHGIFYGILIFRGIGRKLFGPLHLKISLCINIQIKSVFCHQGKGRNTSGSYGSTASAKGNIAGAVAGSYHRQGVCSKTVCHCILVSGRQVNLISYLKIRLIIHQALSGLFREAACGYRRLIHSICKRHKMEGLLLIPYFLKIISTISSHNLGNAFYFLKGQKVILCDSQAGHRLNVHKTGPIKIGITCNSHIRLRGTDSGEKSHTHSHNKENRQESSRAFFDLHKKIFSRCFLHFIYHSISEIGHGFSFTVILDTRPFLI